MLLNCLKTPFNQSNLKTSRLPIPAQYLSMMLNSLEAPLQKSNSRTSLKQKQRTNAEQNMHAERH